MMLPSQLVQNALQNPWMRYVLILLAGITIGAIFYPTKQVKETITKQFQQQIQTLNEQHKSELDQVTKTFDQTISQMQSKNEESNQKIQELTTQVSNLKSHTKTEHYKIVHPDGTVEERDTSDADVDSSSNVSTEVQAEFQQKLQEQEAQLNTTHQQEIQTLQQQWDQKEASYKQQISSMTETKTVTTNPKHFGLEGGYLSDKDYYGHITYDIFGPVFLGLQTQFGGTSNAVGGGIGIRF